MFRILLTAALCSFTFTASASIYNVDISDASGTTTAIGTITTDGTIGTLNPTDILDWNITVTVGGNSYGLTGPLSGGSSVVQMVGSSVSASSTQIFFDFSSTGFSFLDFLGHDTLTNPALFFSNTNGLFPSQVGIQGFPYGIHLFPSSTALDELTALQVASQETLPVVAGVPEISTWAMLLIGFAGISGLCRFLQPHRVVFVNGMQLQPIRSRSSS